MPKPPPWPGGRAFAFTVIDDTDDAVLGRVRPLYALLAELGILTTKTVWPLPAPDDPRWRDTATLADPAYRDFVLELQDRGFEIALHGVRGSSSPRDVVRRGLDRFVEVLGRRPRIHANHSRNADNLYWGEARLPAWRRAAGIHRKGPEASQGHEPASPYFWGDLCRERIDYVRGLSFRHVDTLASDPYMPYHDARFPFVKAWFSCSYGANADAFRRLLSADNVRTLARRGGACFVYTHFGVPGFVDEKGDVEPAIREILVALGGRPGWFRPASEILDHLGGTEPRTLGAVQRLRLEARARRDRILGDLG